MSVVLATKRPEMLAFALRQVRKQRGVDLQLVLAPHGFTPGRRRAARARARATSSSGRTTSPMLFGDVLADAVAAADGDLVLKMDDDDWYGPDFVTDLLLARAYSGAEMVGTPSEMHYLVPEGRHRPARATGPSSTRHFVAGGTMLVDRGLLRVGRLFRSVRKYVDAQLLHAVSRPAPRSTAPTASGTCCAATPPATPGRSTWTTCSTPSASPRSAPVSPPAACSSTTSPSARSPG